MMTEKIFRKEFNTPKGRILISTIWISPALEDEFRYETMVFGPDGFGDEWEQHRTFSREEAKKFFDLCVMIYGAIAKYAKA